MFLLKKGNFRNFLDFSSIEISFVILSQKYDLSSVSNCSQSFQIHSQVKEREPISEFPN